MKEMEIGFEKGEDVLVSDSLDSPGKPAVFYNYTVDAGFPFGVTFPNQMGLVQFYKYCWPLKEQKSAQMKMGETVQKQPNQKEKNMDNECKCECGNGVSGESIDNRYNECSEYPFGVVFTNQDYVIWYKYCRPLDQKQPMTNMGVEDTVAAFKEGYKMACEMFAVGGFDDDCRAEMESGLVDYLTDLREG